MSMAEKKVMLMLSESNAIEGVYDRDSLTQARRAWDFLKKYDSINNMIVKECHKILMKNQDIERKHKGEWRTIPVYIGGVKKDDPPLVINEKMKQWCNHVNETIKNQDKNHQFPIHCHVNFEEIHPFVDGNGRIGRLLLNWQLQRLDIPIIIYTEADKRTYYRLFSSYRAAEMGSIIERMQRENWGNL